MRDSRYDGNFLIGDEPCRWVLCSIGDLLLSINITHLTGTQLYFEGRNNLCHMIDNPNSRLS